MKSCCVTKRSYSKRKTNYN
jgi:hypothetical protein